jgi:redox-sensitive bicupin YhaK (pirin superfamily)
MTAIYELKPHGKDLGDGVHIQRYLPNMEIRSVGPFVFFDYLPAIPFAAGKGSDVRPHPHIGLSTLSWVFNGQVHHRDSLGYDLVVTPGDVLLMTSGRGIVHSERTPQTYRTQAHELHMVQFWLALPQSHEKIEPSVQHARDAELPTLDLGVGVTAKLAIGEYNGTTAPVQTHLAPFMVDITTHQAGELNLGLEERERALFLFQGSVTLADQTFSGPHFLRLSQESMTLNYAPDSRFLLLGGEPLDGPRHLWWNFVASSQELLEDAKQRWRDMAFGTVPGDDQEFIPLP